MPSAQPDLPPLDPNGPPVQEAAPPPEPQWETFEELKARAEPREVLIQGTIKRRGILLLAGPSKAGKSTCLMELALKVAKGGGIWFGRPVTPGTVLFVMPELFRDTVVERMLKLVQALELARVPAGIEFLPLRGVRGWSDLDKLAEKIRRRATEIDAKLVILDSISRLTPQGTEENDNSGIARMMETIECMANEVNAVFAFAHHFAKGNASTKEVADRFSGAGAYLRAADALLTLTPHREEGAWVIEGILREFRAPEPMAFRFKHPVWEHAPDLDPKELKPAVRKTSNKGGDQQQQSATPRDIERLVPASGISHGDLIDVAVERLAIPKGTAKKLVATAMEENLIGRRAGTSQKTPLFRVKDLEENEARKTA